MNSRLGDLIHAMPNKEYGEKLRGSQDDDTEAEETSNISSRSRSASGRTDLDAARDDGPPENRRLFQ